MHFYYILSWSYYSLFFFFILKLSNLQKNEQDSLSSFYRNTIDPVDV